MTIEAGHRPIVTNRSWFAPTTAGMIPNHRLTRAESSVPETVRAPARRNRMRVVGQEEGAAPVSAAGWMH